MLLMKVRGKEGIWDRIREECSVRRRAGKDADAKERKGKRARKLSNVLK